MWPSSAKCKVPGGEYEPHDDDFEYPEGTYCRDVCPEYYHPSIFDDVYSQCVCNGNSCAFNVRKMSRCWPSVCSLETTKMFEEFSLGFDHEDAVTEGFHESLVHCDGLVPQDQR